MKKFTFGVLATAMVGILAIAIVVIPMAIAPVMSSDHSDIKLLIDRWSKGKAFKREVLNALDERRIVAHFAADSARTSHYVRNNLLPKELDGKVREEWILAVEPPPSPFSNKWQLFVTLYFDREDRLIRAKYHRDPPPMF